MPFQNDILAGSSGGAEPGWTIENASYDSKSMSFTGQNSNMRGFTMSADGTKAYGCGDNTVFQYTLSTAWDISTGSYASKTLDVSGQSIDSNGIQWDLSDGKAIYLQSDGVAWQPTNEHCYQYDCTTAWDVSTCSYANKKFNTYPNAPGGYGLFMKNDGSKFYVQSRGNEYNLQFSMSTAWDMSTGGADTAFNSTSQISNDPTGLQMSLDGTKLWLCDSVQDDIYQYTLSTPFSLGSVSYDSISFDVSSQTTSLRHLHFKSDDGMKMYVASGTTVYQYSTE